MSSNSKGFSIGDMISLSRLREGHGDGSKPFGDRSRRHSRESGNPAIRCLNSQQSIF
jgi:hypothetical protein